jgi:hypothetical protein
MKAGPRRSILGAIVIAVLLAAPGAVPARADSLAADLSNSVIKVTSSFTGTEVLLFGAVVAESGPHIGIAGKRDIIVVVRGPPERVTVHMKGRVGPIWTNVEQATFERAPSFYFVASTVPLASIVQRDILDRREIGLEHLRLDAGAAQGGIGRKSEFRDALIALRARFRSPYADNNIPLYTEIADPPRCRTAPDSDCIFRFSGSTLFSVRLPIPVNVPIGKLDISIYLVRNGRIDMAQMQHWQLEVSRIGVEGWLYKHAVSNPLLYGLGAISLALACGLGAAAIFRR